MTTATETRSSKKSSAHKLKGGDKWSRHSYGTVVSKGYQSITVENETGLRWEIGNDIFEQEFTVANQYADTVKVTRTEMVEKIVSAARICMTVNFRKKPDHKDLVAYVESVLDGSVPRPKSSRALSMALKNATAGEERTMVGRHYGASDEFGRLQFTAMESGGGLRLIDPRTVEWAVIDNVRYELKK